MDGGRLALRLRGVRSRRRLLGRMMACVPALALAACTGVPYGDDGGPLEPPEALLLDLRPGRPGLLTQELVARIRFTNPNGVDLAVRGVVVDLEVDGRPLGRGVEDSAFTLPALGRAEVEVPMDVPTGELISRILALIERGRFSYRLSGHLVVERGFGRRERLSFSRESTWSLGLPGTSRGQPPSPRPGWIPVHVRASRSISPAPSPLISAGRQ